MRLIDVDELLDAISVHLERIEQEFEDAPTVIHLCEVCKHRHNTWDSETCDGCTGRECNFKPIDPVRHGRWLSTDTNTCECSVCHTCEPYPFSEFEWCPNCGAKMDEGTKATTRGGRKNDERGV